MGVISENAVGVSSDDHVDDRNGAGKRLIGLVAHMRHCDDVRYARFFKFRCGTSKRRCTFGKIRFRASFGNVFAFIVGQTDDADLDAVKVLHDDCRKRRRRERASGILFKIRGENREGQALYVLSKRFASQVEFVVAECHRVPGHSPHGFPRPRHAARSEKVSPLPKVAGIERQHGSALGLRFCFLVAYECCNAGKTAHCVGVVVNGPAVVDAGRRRMDVVDVQDRQVPGKGVEGG